MKIIIASDSYKESLSSLEVGQVIEKGFKDCIPESDIKVIPIGDGGEGTVESLIDATEGRLINVKVLSPISDEVNAIYGISGDSKTAFIEMATASGIGLVPIDKRNPLITSTYGTGQMILDALENGVEKIIIGIGGSATNDGGIGMASALGVRFLDESGLPIENNNEGLSNLHSIDVTNLDNRITNTEIIVACDVDNPLVGLNGASYVYGPQKGANSDMVKVMDQNLSRLAEVIQRDLNKDIINVPGAGAAGGLGAGLMTFLNGKLESGIDIVLDFLKFDELIDGCDLVITGEGRFDSQTIMNKAPIGVARRAKKKGINCIGISAVFGDSVETLLDNGFDAVFSVVNRVDSLDKIMASTKENLYLTSINIAKLLKLRDSI
ncbi:glycerate kinase [Mycoplasmatota bacterium]|nr:glycerate kinase [Mycoplasmatota bacterium]